jgi:cystathionine beta-lyase
MDFELAPAVAAALSSAVDRGDTGYAMPGRLPEAFAEFATARYGWTVDPATVFVGPDVMTGVAEVLRAFTSPGDGVVINPPVYPPFFRTITRVDRSVLEVPLLPIEKGFELDLDALESGFAGGARAYLLCNPHNPSGRVFTRGQLRAIAELAARYEVLVISDEIHGPLALPGAAHVPLPVAADGDMHEWVVLTSASKGWNVPGLKCSILVAGPGRIAERLGELGDELRDRTGHLGVLASEAAFGAGAAWLDTVVERLDANRRLLRELVSRRLPGVVYREPEATYLAWLDCRALGLGDDPAAAFLERGRVALSSGPAFGSEGAGHARLNFGTSPEILEEIVQRMAGAVSGGSSAAP